MPITDLLSTYCGLVIYETSSRSIEVRLERDTVRLTQSQLTRLLDTSTNDIGSDLRNVYAAGELDVEATTEEISVIHQESAQRGCLRLTPYN